SSMEILRGVEAGLERTDYTLVIRTIEHLADRDRVFDACCVRGRADGVLIISVTPTGQLVERLRRGRYPAVLVDRTHAQLSWVAVDYEAGEAEAVQHCIDLGHRRIALIDRPDDPFAPVAPSARQRGYREALAAAG